MNSTSAPYPTAQCVPAPPVAAARKALGSVCVARGRLAGCAGLPVPADRSESHAIADVADTSLARTAAASRPGDARDLPAFACCPTGDDALEARITLIRRAEKSVDVQYYLIANDRTGRQFLAELSAAAARGVRVRLLVDDLNAIRQDALFAALAGQPGFQVRLFNPLPVRGGGFASRVAFSAHEFARINHRMHNKLLIADGSFAVSGGRNIANEYFDRGGSAHFIDMDLLSSALSSPRCRRCSTSSGIRPTPTRREPDARAPARPAPRAASRRRRRRPCRTAPTTSRLRAGLARRRARRPAGSRCASRRRASSPTGRRRSPTTTARAPTARSCAPTSSCSLGAVERPGRDAVFRPRAQRRWKRCATRAPRTSASRS
jgi:hypothetical protein